MKTPLIAALAAFCFDLNLFTALVSASGTDLGQRVTIDVTNAPPQQVFKTLANSLHCKITVHRGLKAPVTLRMVDARIDTEILPKLSKLLDCEWTFDGKNLSIRPMPASRKRSEREMDAFVNKLNSPLPANMRFEGVKLESALKAIGNAVGLKIQPWRGEGDYKVTLDAGGKTVDDAIKALLAKVPNPEGVVLIRTPNAAMAQRRYLPRPMSDSSQK